MENEWNLVYFDHISLNSALLDHYAQLPNQLPYLRLYSQEQSETMAATITYRVENALYRLFLEDNPDDTLSWKDFYTFLMWAVPLQKAAKAVVLHAVQNYNYAQLDFRQNPEAIAEFEGEDEFVQMCKLYTAEEGDHLIQCISMLAEWGYYSRLCRLKGPDYSWLTYLKDLLKHADVTQNLFTAVQNVIFSLNFRESWLADDIDELNSAWPELLGNQE